MEVKKGERGYMRRTVLENLQQVLEGVLRADKALWKAIEAGKALRDVLEATAYFLQSFEFTFDGDWPHTLTILSAGQRTFELFIKPDGTFLNPGVEDETSNWANRGALLNAYRELLRALENAERTLQAQRKSPEQTSTGEPGE